MADVLISQLPKTDSAGDADLLIIDSFDSATGGIVTNAIKWSDLYTKISSFPQGIKFPDGTALQPSITFVNDTNTGLYRQADDTLGVTTNGIARVVVGPQGNVGINTLTPEEKLQIKEGNLSIIYGTSNELKLGAADGGVSIRQTKFLPLTFATNDIARMRITGFGSVLIATDNEVSGVALNVGGVIQADGATINGKEGGVTAIGHNTGTKKDLLHLNFNGALGNIDQNYGANGQVLTSRGPGQSWVWASGGGGGGGGGGLDFKGAINVTVTAPAAIDGDFYLNDTAGLVHPTFGVGDFNAEVNAFVIYNGTEWIIQNQAPTGTYVDLVSDQTINGSKTFTQEILGTAQNCGRTITAGGGLKGGGQLLSDLTLEVDTGDGLGIVNDNLVALAGDETIIVDAAGIKVDLSKIFSDDPAQAFGVASWNGRKGAVSPEDGDYALGQLSDVDVSSGGEGQVLTKVGSQFLLREVKVPGALAFQGELDATLVVAPEAEPGYFWVNEGVGTVLDDASWGTIKGEAVIEGDLIAKGTDTEGEPPRWDIIGNVGGNAGVQTITAQNGVVNLGTEADPVIEADNTVVRTTGDQTLGGSKTFSETIIGNLQGNVEGEAQDCSRSVLAGQALTGGGKLNADVTLDVSYDSSLEIISDQLSVLSGNGLKNGDDGTGGPLTIDTDWLDDNYTPDVSGVVGNGEIGLKASTNAGLLVQGQNAFANQDIATEWQIGVDSTVVRTINDQTIDGNKTFVQNIICDGVTSANFTTSADLTATGKISFANLNIDALDPLPAV
jgi:hypothetical protein